MDEILISARNRIREEFLLIEKVSDTASVLEPYKVILQKQPRLRCLRHSFIFNTAVFVFR